MSKKLAQLRGQRDETAKKIHALNDKYAADARMAKEDADQVDKYLVDIEAIDGEITREQKIAKIQLENQLDAGDVIDPLLNKHTREENAKNKETAAIRAFLTGGISNLTPEQRAIMVARQTPDIRNAMSTTTTTEGGYTTATEYYKSLEVALKLYGGVRPVAKIVRSASGIDMNFPTADPTGEVGELLAQNAAAATGETAFGNVAVSVYKYSSKKIALPFELVQDTFIDIEAYINDILAMRIGRITNQHYTTGTGSAQPRGVVVAAASGKVGTTGQTLTVIYDDLVDLEHSLNPLYRKLPGVGYMMADSSVKVVRKIKDSQSRPLFVPGYEVGVPGGEPDRLMGRPIYVNDDMAAMAANAKSILFGAFSKYVVRDVMDLTLFRMTDSAFTLNGQVGFVGFMRTGGNLVDNSGASVKYYQNSAT